MTAVKITLVALILLPATALAQQGPIELHAVDTHAPLRVAAAEADGYGYTQGIAFTDERSYKRALKKAMREESGYYASRAKRGGGIALIVVGGVAALITGMLALSAAGEDDREDRSSCDGGYCAPDFRISKEAAPGLGIAAILSLGVALGVGVPLVVSGVRDGREIRRRARRRLAAGSVRLANGPGQAGLGLRYQF